MDKEDRKQWPGRSFSPRSEPCAPGAGLERAKILIVDDKKANLVALRRVLAGLEADIIEADNGNEALAATLVHRFAAAILDVMMPGMDGYELADHLRGDPNTRNLPIIFLTAVYSGEGRIFEGYEAGAVDYIVKPYKPEVLRSKVRVFLDLDRARAALAEKIVSLTTSEERFRSLVTTIPDIVYRIDAEGRFTYLNNAVRSLGYTQEELLGRRFSKIVLPAHMNNVSRESVLPGYRGRRTDPDEAPKLFDERRTGDRITVGLEVSLVPRDGNRHLAGRTDIIAAEINSSGIYAHGSEGEKTTLLGTVGVIRDITARKRAEGELEKYRGKLEELVKKRVKEQVCLYGISELLAEPHEAMEDVLHRVAGLIPSGWQYPDITCARLRLDNRTDVSEPFCESRWGLSADIVISGRTRGAIEVFYMEERPAMDQGPFLKEETDLIAGIARLIGQAVDRMETRAREAHLNAVLRSIRNVNHLIMQEKRRDCLIQGACDNLVTSRGFHGAWIVLTDGAPSGMQHACTGFENGAFAPLTAMLRAGKAPPCRRCDQSEGGVVTIDDPVAGCGECPLADFYPGNAAMTVVLRHDEREYGWLGVSLPMAFAAHREETSLLAEIAGDIAFGLHNMDLELKRSRYAQIVAGSSEAMALVDHGYVYLEANPSYCGLVNRDNTVLAGQRLEDVLGKSLFRDVVKPRLNRCFTGEEIRSYEALEISGAAPRSVDTLYTPCLADDGTVSAAAVCIRDITAHKRAEALLRESEKKYRTLFESLVDGVVECNLDGDIMGCNQAYGNVTGHTLEEIKKLTYQDLTPEKWHQVDEQYINQALTRGYSDAYEKERLRRDGTVFPVSMRIWSKNDDQGRPTGFWGILRDISDRVQAEAEQKRLEAQLRQAQKMEAIGTLAGGVAHDFNNKLGVILGHTQMMLMDMKPGDPLYEDLEVIQDASRRSVDLTRQLLAFARKQTIAPRVLDLNKTLAGMLKMLRRLIGEDIDLEWRPEADLWPVKVDPAQIDQILANLCVNSRDAINGVGKVTIETKSVILNDLYCAEHPDFVPGEFARIAVSDNGCGMNKKTLDQIFEPFFTSKGFGKGTGLGLSTVYGIVKQNEGFINVYSEPGKGTTVIVYIPRHQGDIARDTHAASAEVPKARGETILLVEDDSSILRMARLMLEKLGYAVHAANSPDEAMEMARGRSERIHVLLTDVVMPQMSGKELAERITKLRPEIKTLFMSGYTANIIARHGILDEELHFLEKPFAADSLARKIREVLAKTENEE